MLLGRRWLPDFVVYRNDVEWDDGEPVSDDATAHDDRCRCHCHLFHSTSAGVRRTDVIAAVFACDLCRRLHCPALSSQEPPEQPG